MVRRANRPDFIGLVFFALSTYVIAAGVNAAEIKPVTATRGMVFSVSPSASAVGASILRAGGNAVDAAVATAMALAVTYPPAGNIGGGGFMLVLPAPGVEPVCIEYRETAPAAATETMFTLGETHLSAKAVGVPGTVHGLALAHRKYGRLPWNVLLQPAIGLARDGFAVDAALARSLNHVLADKKSRRCTEMLRVYRAPHSTTWERGDRLRQPDLAATLERIANQGPNGFYRGTTARKIVAEMKAGGGIITLEDLDRYRAKVRAPIHGTYRGFDIYGPPPPSSGGIVLIEMLNMLEPFKLREYGRWAPDTVHLMIEVMRRAYLDRARYLGDRDFVTIPTRLTTKDYAARLGARIDRRRATPSTSLAPEISLADGESSTTHFSIVDAHGMAVANTFTLEQSYGSRIMVRGAGFLLNNEMGDFNWTPGHTDRRGRIGTQPNRIAPGKRMLSSQTPVLVLHHGNPYLVTGSPGGRTIINTVLCVILNTLEFEMDLPAAIAAPRLHHQWLPDKVRFAAWREAPYRKLVTRLESMGHVFESRAGKQGDAHSILVDSTRHVLVGVADNRISGKAVGVDPLE